MKISSEKQKMSKEETSKVDVAPTTEAKAPEEIPKVSAAEMFQFADSKDKALMTVGLICAFLSGASMPAFSFVFGEMINQLAGGGVDVEEQLARTALIMVWVGIGVFVLMSGHVACFLIAADRQIARIRSRFFAAVLRQDIGWHDENKTGALIARMTGDTRSIQAGINDKLSQGVSQFGMFLFGFGFGFYSSWELTLVMLGTMPLIAASGAMMTSVVTAMTESSRASFAKAGAAATEALENARTVQVFGREEFEVGRFHESVVAAEGANIKKEMSLGLGVGVTYCVMFSSYSVAFWFSAYLIIWGRSDVGKITATFFSVLMGSFGIGMMFPSIQAFAEAQGAAFKVYEIINRVPTLDIEAEGKPISTIRDEIRFSNVSFSYPTRRDQILFKDLNVTIRRGQKVAFSGSSGCGKSSIVGLLQRFYDPLSGAVEVDGVNLKDIELRKWRDLIGIVSQEPQLFSGSILENVRVGKADATLEEVQEACKKANIHETVMTLSDQYDTLVGAVGSQLSGGQKQRLAIARAIIKNPQLLILDEATSALDRKSEAEVQEALQAVIDAGHNMTVVVIAHRLSTIRNVDVIHYIHFDSEHGSAIVEAGSFDELMAKGGQFALMAMKQDAAGGAASPVGSPTPGHMSTRNAEESTFEHENQTQDEISKQAEIETNSTEVPMMRILKMNIANFWALVLAMIGSILSGGVYPVYSVVFGKMLEILAIYATNSEKLLQETRLWGTLFIALGFAALVGWALQGMYAYAGEKLTTMLRTMLLRSILRQDQTFFDTPGRDAGALSAVISGDCAAVHQLWGPSIGYKVQMLANIGAGLGIAFYYQWKLAFVVLSTLPVMVVTGAMQQMILTGAGHNEQDAGATVVSESLSNVRTVTSFNLKWRKAAQYTSIADLLAPGNLRNSIVIGIVFGFSQFSFYGVFALSFWYGGKLIGKGEATFGDVIIASMAVLMGAMGAGEAGGFAAKLNDAQIAAKRVFAIIDRKPQIDAEQPNGDTNLGEGCSIDLNELKFIYPARPKQTVLRKVELTFNNCTQNGIMGQTGCGKSTIIQLLARFYDPAAGTILINGHPLRAIDLKTWRRNISIVLQEPCLFSGTVLENIRYGRPEATVEEVHHAARLAQIHDDVLEMPHGYETEVGYKGSALSGGQKQRVAIARGLLRRPRLLLLDEATSALDNATEARVLQGIIAAHAEHPMTVVSIAHRLTTIRHSDQIVLLDSGEILEQGNHDTLIALNGEYKARWDMYQASIQ